MAVEGHNGASSPSENPTRVDHSLDELARGLARGTVSRGKALRWMGGVLLGGVLAAFPGVAWADDDCRPFGRRCRRDSQCCSRNCVRRGDDDKTCGCPVGKRRCGGRCVTDCTAPKVLNRDTCQCECPTVACEGGRVLDANCQCVCPPGQEPQCGVAGAPTGPCVSRTTCSAAETGACAGSGQECCPIEDPRGPCISTAGFQCVAPGTTCPVPS
jgi:hypothetical protein